MANSFFFSLLMLFLAALMLVPQGFANTVYFRPGPQFRSPQYRQGTRPYYPYCPFCRRGPPPTHL